MNIRLIANLTMATLLLIVSACTGLFPRNESTAASGAISGDAAGTGVIGDRVDTAKAWTGVPAK
jgi:hypothetical protein